MEITYFKKISFNDVPGKPAAVIYLPYCNFRCPYCFSKENVLPELAKKNSSIPEKEILSFLKGKREWIDTVLITGGEPTLHKSLPKFCAKLKKIGYRVKIETNGSNPEMIELLVKNRLVDCLSIDIKAPKGKYSKVIGISKVSVFYLLEKIERTINLTKKSDIDYEFKTTVVPQILSKKDVLEIIKWLKPAKKFVIQKFKPTKTIDSRFEKVKPYSDDFYNSLLKAASPFFDDVRIQ